MVRRFLFLLGIVPAIPRSATAQRPPTRPAIVAMFAVQKYGGDSVRLVAPERSWNATSDGDSVFLALPGGAVVVDSIKWSARSGVPGLDEDVVDPGPADANGVWATIPDSLFLRVDRSASEGTIRLLAGFAPERAIEWVRRRRPRHPYLTRLRADIWISGRRSRAELEIYQMD